MTIKSYVRFTFTGLTLRFVFMAVVLNPITAEGGKIAKFCSLPVKLENLCKIQVLL